MNLISTENGGEMKNEIGSFSFLIFFYLFLRECLQEKHNAA